MQRNIKSSAMFVGSIERIFTQLYRQR